MRPALEWLAASKRYATFCAARLREHHLANPPRRPLPDFDPDSATGAIPLSLIRHLLPQEALDNDATPDSDYATPDDGRQTRRVNLADLKTGQTPDEDKSTDEAGSPADPPNGRPKPAATPDTPDDPSSAGSRHPRRRRPRPTKPE